MTASDPSLTGKEKRKLRAAAHSLPVCVHVGHAGLTDATVRAVRAAVAKAELVKVRLPAGPRADRRALADELADRVGAVHVGGVGRTAVLYVAPSDSSRPADGGTDRP